MLNSRSKQKGRKYVERNGESISEEGMRLCCMDTCTPREDCRPDIDSAYLSIISYCIKYIL